MKAMTMWLIIMVGLVALGIVGGIQSDAPVSEWGWFVLGCAIIGIVGVGVIGTFQRKPKQESPKPDHPVGIKHQ